MSKGNVTVQVQHITNRRGVNSCGATPKQDVKKCKKVLSLRPSRTLRFNFRARLIQLQSNVMNENKNAKHNARGYPNFPNPVMVSRQLEELREVLRRMRAVQSQSLDVLTHKKLEQIQS